MAGGGNAIRFRHPKLFNLLRTLSRLLNGLEEAMFRGQLPTMRAIGSLIRLQLVLNENFQRLDLLHVAPFPLDRGEKQM